MPLYQGVKFIPKIGSKLPATSGQGLLSQKHHVTEDVLKTRPVFMQNRKELAAAVAKSTNTGIQIVANKLNSSANSLPSRGVAKSSSFKQSTFKPAPKTNTATAINTCKTLQTAENAGNGILNTTSVLSSNLNSTVCLNSAANSTALEHAHDSARNLNESGSSIQTSGTNMSGFGWSRERKKTAAQDTSRSNSNANNYSGFLHTELRAQKRQEFEMTLKEKDRIVAKLKREMEAEKLRKQQDEIQKIRLQNTFRSRPIMHYKPVEIKPSEKPLTDPKSPQFGAAAIRGSRTNLHATATGPFIKQSSGSNITAPGCDISALSSNANALLDAAMPVITKTTSSSSLGNSSSFRNGAEKSASQQALASADRQ